MNSGHLTETARLRAVFAFSPFLLVPVAKKVGAGGGLRVAIGLLCIARLTLVPRQRSGT